jgi:hypothetical protein
MPQEFGRLRLLDNGTARKLENVSYPGVMRVWFEGHQFTVPQGQSIILPPGVQVIMELAIEGAPAELTVLQHDNSGD